MFKSRASIKPLILSITFLSLPLIASAQANRTWVSGLGDDVNPCSRTSPCKTFAGAIFKTTVGGEINVRDTGGFGMVTITKSITIDAPRSSASILAVGSFGILINITAVADSAKTVRLRGLSINGLGSATDGIRIIAANQVFIEDLLVDGVSRHGITVGASGAYVSVARSTIRNAAKVGINMEPGGTTSAVLAMESTNVSTCEAGLFARGAIATVRDSALLHNVTGVDAQDSDVALVDCLVAHGQRGLVARTNSAIRITLTTVTRNQTGLAVVSGGKIISFKNNIVHGNGTDGAPTSTAPPV
ncbi:MAG TPA: hypothetical protein VIG25_12885 [Pyrinomonadaceae bacterium]|jgi:hypothetical protein